jgi:hypothetical protein
MGWPHLFGAITFPVITNSAFNKQIRTVPSSFTILGLAQICQTGKQTKKQTFPSN